MIQWGNVAEWVGGVGTAAAFFVGLRVLLLEVRDRREIHHDRLAEQARLVSAWGKTPTPHGAHVVVVNRSEEPVYDVRIFLQDDGPHASQPPDLSEQVLPPGTRLEPLVDSTEERMRLHLGRRAVPVTVLFTDSRGKRWARTADGRLLAVIPDPRSTYGPIYYYWDHKLTRRTGDPTLEGW